MSDRWRRPVATVAVVLSVVTAACSSATPAEPGRDETGRDETGQAEPGAAGPSHPVPRRAPSFADEFEQDALDRSRWTTCYWWHDDGCTNSGNRELQWYLPDNVSIEGGVLRLEARRDPVRGSDGADYPYTSGMVTTGRSEDDQAQQPRFGFQSGRVEVRMRMPEGKGLWPALWLLPLTHESRPEIDVMEILGDTPATLRAHFHYLDDGERASRGHTWRGADSSAGWHRYGLRWTPEELVWLVDGKEQWRFSEEELIPDEPMYLLINLAVGGEWPGDPAPSTDFPAALEVDYVRIWQRDP